MYLWRKLATKEWLERAEEVLRARAGERMAVIELPARKKITVQVTCSSLAQARRLAREFDGVIEKIPGNWWKKFSQPPKAFSLRVGKRLVISNSKQKSRPIGPLPASSTRSVAGVASHIVIPAGLAFGTGDHATTAMSLRLLEEITRAPVNEWSAADVGTGSGILALAARVFGAQRVYAIDNDPSAIGVAKENARRNKISGIDFRAGDATKWRAPRRVNVVTANLFSELLIAALPGIRRYLAKSGVVILSGILRKQEREVVRALRRHGFQVLTTRRRGRWVAILARIA